MPCNVVWAEGVLGGDGRSRYATNTLLNTSIDRCEIGFVHRNGWSELPADAKGAVVVVHGGNLAGQEDDLVKRMSSFAWAVTIIMGDESRLFNSRPFTGPRREVWRQYPIPGRHGHEDRRLIAGYPQDCPAHLEHLKAEMVNKTLDWSFMGQVSNPSRWACAAQLRGMNHGYLYETPGFWQGLPRDAYYKIMASSKVVPCPAGAAFPESLRLGEALEAGCVPVVEDHLFGGVSYWRYVLGEEPPFPTLTDWAAWPAMLEQVLANWPANRDHLRAWWQGYKAKMAVWLTDDVKAVCDGT